MREEYGKWGSSTHTCSVAGKVLVSIDGNANMIFLGDVIPVNKRQPYIRLHENVQSEISYSNLEDTSSHSHVFAASSVYIIRASSL